MIAQHFVQTCFDRNGGNIVSGRMFVVRTRRHLPQTVCLIAGIVLLRCNCHEFHVNVNSHHYGHIASSVFRFRDFEPRVTSELFNNAVRVQPAAAGVTIEARDGAEAISAPSAARDSTGTQAISNALVRKSRGFQFYSSGNDVTIDMEFIIPFFKVPVERSMNLSKKLLGNLLNLNRIGMLVSGGMAVLGALVGGIFKLFITPTVVAGALKKKSRATDADTAFPDPIDDPFTNTLIVDSVERIGEFLDTMGTKLHATNESNLNVCIQKSICGYVKRSLLNVHKGRGTNIDMIIDGLTIWNPLEHLTAGTAVQHAIDVGRSHSKCDRVYRNCKWRKSEYATMQLIYSFINYVRTS